MFSSGQSKRAQYPRENLLVAFIRAMGFFLFYYTVRTVVFTAASIFYAFKYHNTEDAYAAYMNNSHALSFVSALIIVLSLALFFASQKKSVSKAFYAGKPKASALALCFAIGISLNFTASYIISLLPEKLLESYGEATEGLSDGHIVWYILAVVIMAPVVEELIFRSMMISRFSTAVGNTVAIIFSSIIFGAVHGHIVWSLYAFAIGLLFGVIFTRSRSVLASIAAHVGFNIVSITSRLDGLSEQSAQILGGVLSVAQIVSIPLSALLVLLFIKGSAASFDKTPIGIEEI